MTNQIIQFLYVLLFCTLSILVTVYINNRSHLKKKPWYALAEQTGLKFVNNYPAEKAYVMGHYFGCQLKLDAFHDPITNAGLYTRITLFPNQDTNYSPTANELTIEQGAKLLHSSFGYRLKGKVDAETNGQTIIYTQPGIENDIKYLQTVFSLLYEITTTYPSLVTLGGEFVSALVSDIADKKIQALRPLTIQLIRDIGEETTTKCSDKTSNLLCPHCLTRYIPLQAQISRINTPITYYGCRSCHQSKEYLEGQVVAVLNDKMVQLTSKQNGVLYVNWLVRQQMFDFDEIEIARATDKDVEVLAVRVGNDTDPFRQKRYKTMNCVVSADCELTENTMRVLRRMFGQVEKRCVNQGVVDGKQQEEKSI